MSEFNQSDKQAWQIILDQQVELKRLKGNRWLTHVKPVLIAISFGWLGMPFVFNLAMNSLLPQPVRETITAINAWYSDTTLGLQCAYRRDR